MSGAGPGRALSLAERVARALDAAGERTGTDLLAFVREHCKEDAETIAEIEALLGAASEINPVLDSAEFAPDRAALDRLHAELTAKAGTAGSAGAEAESKDASSPGTIGQYRIIRVVGEGGMGLVYEAEQPSPRRRVAIKVIARGVATRAMLARFRNEAQVLGQLKHPGIAQIFEASTDLASGRAFFVMEFVEGVPLTKFARERGLHDRERIELVVRVCEAVQHAHQKGVVHRDLKPANILVEATDGPPAPKVLDFGVAKLTNAEGESATLAVDANRIVGTLGYMSPEQFDPRPGSVDTRSDVYALGVILYELLADRMPLDLSDLTLTQAATRVRDETPPRLGRVRPSLRGDLEIIAAKALNKDREQRYASAAELAADLKRFIAHEPIMARAPGTLYTIRKFARRKPALTAISAVSVLALIAATVFSWMQYRGAVRAREAEAAQALIANQRAAAEAEARKLADTSGKVAEAVKEFLIVQMIGAASPERQGYDVKVVDVLAQAEKEISGRFASQPLIEGEIRFALGRVYDNLGLFQKSMEQYDGAIAIFGTLEGETGPRTVAAKSQRAVCLANSGRMEASLAEYEKIAPFIDSALKDNKQALVANLVSMGNMYQSLQRFDEAEAVLRKAIAIAEESLPVGSTDRINARATYLAMLGAMKRQADVAPQLEQLLIEQESAHGKSHPLSLTTRNNLVNALLNLGRDADAMQYASSMVEQSESIFPEGHPYRGLTLATVALVLKRNGRGAEGAPMAVRAYDLLNLTDGDFGFFAEKAADFALLCYTDANDEKQAHDWALRYAATRFRFGGDNERPSLRARLNAVAKPLHRGNSDEDARKTLVEVMDRAADWIAPGDQRNPRMYINFARACLELGMPDRARQALAEADKLLAAPGASDELKAMARTAREELKSAAHKPAGG